MSLYGMKRAHLVTDESTSQLTPCSGTAERWRVDLDRGRPVLSRRIALVSVLILVVALIFELPQLLQLLTGTDWFYDLARWSFTAPFSLPGWLNTILGVAGALAGLERALRLQHNWLLD